MTDDDVPFVWGVEDKYRHSQTKRLILFVKLRRSFAYMSLCEMNCKQLRKRPLFYLKGIKGCKAKGLHRSISFRILKIKLYKGEVKMNKRAWLFTRLSTFTSNEHLANTMKQCREQAVAKGYTVVDETVIIGSSELSKAAIKDIIAHNDTENGAQTIFSLSGTSLSRDLKEGQEIYEMITSSGLKFDTPDNNHVVLDKNNPVGAVMGLIVNGEKEIPDDFPFEDQEDVFEPDELDPWENITQSM